MNKPIPDFTETLIWSAQESLQKRFPGCTNIQLIARETRIRPFVRERSDCIVSLRRVPADYGRTEMQEQEAA